jgi:hypothetical protein
VQEWIKLGFVKDIDLETGNIVVSGQGWSLFKEAEGGRRSVLQILSNYAFEKNLDKSSKLSEQLHELETKNESRYEYETKSSEIQAQQDKLHTIIVFNADTGQSVGTVKYNDISIFR